MGEEIEEFYIEYEEKFLKYCMQVFEIGQKHYKIRTDEINEFFKTVDASKKQNQDEGIKHMEEFLSRKSEIFSTISELQHLLNTDKISEENYKPRIKEYTKEFNAMSHKAWKELMRLELILFEQMEDVIQNFDHVISKYYIVIVLKCNKIYNKIFYETFGHINSIFSVYPKTLSYQFICCFIYSFLK